MKERFIKRYRDNILAYLSYKGTGEGRRAILYVISEYERILEEEFNLTHEEVRSIYYEIYSDYYTEVSK